MYMYWQQVNNLTLFIMSKYSCHFPISSMIYFFRFFKVHQEGKRAIIESVIFDISTHQNLPL